MNSNTQLIFKTEAPEVEFDGEFQAAEICAMEDARILKEIELVTLEMTPKEVVRRLATIRRIANLEPIEGADRIERATVDGWELVTAKENGFKVGDLCLYLEIDSWVPTKLAPFLSKGLKNPRTYNGVEGERLKTIRLRGQVSQGLILPLQDYAGHPAVYSPEWAENDAVPLENICMVEEGDDLTEFLGIQKWEKAIPANLAGIVKGNWPQFLQKTDQERIQNCTRYFERWKTPDMTWEVTEKLDGSSMTVYHNNGDTGVCSRNLDLAEDDTNSFWEVAKANNIINKLFELNRNLAIQGELVGEGVQGNKYDLKGRDLYVFDIFDIDKKAYVNSFERQELVIALGLKHVPILSVNAAPYRLTGETTIQTLLEMADDFSILNPKKGREGIVFKCHQKPDTSFKAISNAWLLKNDG